MQSQMCSRARDDGGKLEPQRVLLRLFILDEDWFCQIEDVLVAMLRSVAVLSWVQGHARYDNPLAALGNVSVCPAVAFLPNIIVQPGPLRLFADIYMDGKSLSGTPLLCCLGGE